MIPTFRVLVAAKTFNDPLLPALWHGGHLRRAEELLRGVGGGRQRQQQRRLLHVGHSPSGHDDMMRAHNRSSNQGARNKWGAPRDRRRRRERRHVRNAEVEWENASEAARRNPHMHAYYMICCRRECNVGTWMEGRARGAINYELDMLLDGAGRGRRRSP